MNTAIAEKNLFYDFHTHQRYEDENIVAVENVIIGKESDADKKIFCAGLHPLFLENINIEEALSDLETKIKKNNCWYVGECGFDRRAATPMALQQDIFIKQIFLAEKYQKPIVIHCVKAFEMLIMVKKKYRPEVPMIVHGFNNNLAIFATLQQEGFYFSFGAALLHEKSNAIEALRKVNKNNFFLETDNKNINISSVYDAAAKHLDTDLKSIQSIISTNLWTIRNSAQSHTK